jgi:hypothetical protein
MMMMMMIMTTTTVLDAPAARAKDSHNSPLFGIAAINRPRKCPNEDQLTRILLSQTPSDFNGICQNLTVKSVFE